MTKWFDTTTYLVPRLTRDQRFVLTDNRPLAQFRKRRHSRSERGRCCSAR
jgi:hypothetical protein